MSRFSFLLLLLFIINGYATVAQHPLVGTWEMISIAGVNADGNKFNLDSTSIHETKIITPTHYILIAMDKEDGKWKFNRCYFGTTKMEGSKYYEYPVSSSETIYENVKTDFNWKIDGKEFTQSGFITRPDGKTIVLDKFLFGRSAVAPVAGQKFVGTWQAEQAGVKSFLVVSTTHWMAIEKQNQKFTRAWGGVYKLNGNRAELSVLYGTESDKLVSAEWKGKEVIFNNLTFSRIN